MEVFCQGTRVKMIRIVKLIDSVIKTTLWVASRRGCVIITVCGVHCQWFEVIVIKVEDLFGESSGVGAKGV